MPTFLSPGTCGSNIVIGSKLTCVVFFRFLRTQLLLWPSFKLSSPSLTSSSVLNDLVFTSHTLSGYSHVSHRVYPLKTSAHTSAELTKISATVNKDQEVESSEEKVNPVPEAATPTSEYTCWTNVPLFLITYTPKVGRRNCVLNWLVAMELCLFL